MNSHLPHTIWFPFTVNPTKFLSFLCPWYVFKNRLVFASHNFISLSVDLYNKNKTKGWQTILSIKAIAMPKKWSGQMWGCESCHAPTGNFWEFDSNSVWNYHIVKLLTIYCSIGGVALTVLSECHIDCSIRVSRSFAKFPMAESDPAKTGLAGPLAMALSTVLCGATPLH